MDSIKIVMDQTGAGTTVEAPDGTSLTRMFSLSRITAEVSADDQIVKGVLELNLFRLEAHPQSVRWQAMVNGSLVDIAAIETKDGRRLLFREDGSVEVLVIETGMYERAEK